MWVWVRARVRAYVDDCTCCDGDGVDTLLLVIYRLHLLLLLPFQKLLRGLGGAPGLPHLYHLLHAT